METYSFLRELADSWVLLTMTLFFLGVILWAFRPGSSRIHREVKGIPFRHEDKPKQDWPKQDWPLTDKEAQK